MTRADTIARLEALEAELIGDLSRCQVRDQHITLSVRIGEVQRIIADLRAPVAAA